MRTLIVTGTDNETHLSRRLEGRAPDHIAARQQANALGLMVSDVVDSAGEPDPAITRPADVRHVEDHYLRLIRSPEHRALKRAVFLGSLQALAVFAAGVVVFLVVWGFLSRLFFWGEGRCVGLGVRHLSSAGRAAFL